MSELLIHRGIVNKKYKENLLKSFKKSFDKGYGVETDIHATKDNEFICFHDFTLNRIFKKKKSIKELNYSKIKYISTKDNRPIPLLRDLLKASKNKYPLFIEIKPNLSKKLLIKLFKETYNYLADPHTATGLSVMHETNLNHPTVCLGCAHPAKFSNAIKNSIGIEPEIPKVLENIFDKEEKMNILSNKTEDIKNFILNNI